LVTVEIADGCFIAFTRAFLIAVTVLLTIKEFVTATKTTAVISAIDATVGAWPGIAAIRIAGALNRTIHVAHSGG